MSSTRVIQLPRTWRILLTLYLCVCGVVGAVAVPILVASGRSGLAAYAGVWLVIVLLLAYRVPNVSVVLERNELVVRNLFTRTRRLPRRDIEGFRTESPMLQPFTRYIYAQLREDTGIRLDPTVRVELFRRSKRAREEQLRQLRSWLGSTR
jgi:hypothetical protein